MNVIDREGYARYRDAMTPILTAMGGSFGYDLVVSEVLRSPVSHPITRLFTMTFPSRAVRERFFADPHYQRARTEHFERAVNGYTVIAERDKA